MPVDWLQVPLGEVCRIEIGGTPSRNVPRFWADKHSGYPWLSIADLKASRVYDTAERITDAGVRNSNVKPIPANTPVMSFKLTIGRAAVAGVNMYSNEAIAAFHADSTVIAPGWLFYELPRAALRGISDTAVKGSTLNKAKLRKLPLELPPLPEQRQIAEILDTLDEAIRKTEQIIAKLQQVKQGLLHDLLTRGIDDNGELRDPDRHPEQFKDSPLGRIPKGWDVDCLEALTARRIVDGVHHTPTYVAQGVPFLTVENLTRGPGISLTPCRYVSERAHREYFLRADPRPGDVLVSKDGTLGVARIVPEGFPEASIFVSVALLRPRPDRILPGIIREFFETHWFHRQLGTQSAGTGLKHIHLEHFRAFRLAVPPLVEQRHICERISALEAVSTREQEQLSKLRLLKSGLMEDLLTGRVRVTKLLEQAAE